MEETFTQSDSEFNEVSANLLLDSIKDVLSKKVYFYLNFVIFIFKYNKLNMILVNI